MTDDYDPHDGWICTFDFPMEKTAVEIASAKQAKGYIAHVRKSAAGNYFVMYKLPKSGGKKRK